MKVTIKLNDKVIFESDDQAYADKIKKFLDDMQARRAAFREKVESGGFATKLLPINELKQIDDR